LGYTSIVSGLKEDLEVELESIRDQFEERRRIGIEKNKEKNIIIRI